MYPVLFASTKPLERAENLKAIYDAYEGPKAFCRMDPWRHHAEIKSGKYKLMVCDEFPTESPGKIIMIGHGYAGGKTSGLEQPHPYMNPAHADLMDYVICSGRGMVEKVAQYSGVHPNQVLPLGMPRTDQYIGKHKGDGKTELAKYRKTYLYVPTYRSKEESPLPSIDWQWLDDQLNDDELIAVKGHMMSGRLLKRTYKHITEYSNSEISAPYLYDADVVITDYSTIMFDAYLLNKPVVLFDRNFDYLQTRGMQLDYPYQYSSRWCNTETEMLSMIRDADGLTEVEKECRRLVSDACDGGSILRICELIRRVNK